jgi:hypothetical protein
MVAAGDGSHGGVVLTDDIGEDAAWALARRAVPGLDDEDRRYFHENPLTDLRSAARPESKP